MFLWHSPSPFHERNLFSTKGCGTLTFLAVHREGSYFRPWRQGYPLSESGIVENPLLLPVSTCPSTGSSELNEHTMLGKTSRQNAKHMASRAVTGGLSPASGTSS